MAEWPKIPVMEALIGDISADPDRRRVQVIAGSHMLLETEDVQAACVLMCAYNVRLSWFAVAPAAARQTPFTTEEIEERYTMAYRYYTN